MSVGVGDPAPDFTLRGVQGTERRDYTLSELRGHKVVLAFYPGDFTAGCTKQLCSYRDQFDDFEGVDATVLGISPQEVDSHERWIAERGFQFPLLADPEKKVVKAYDLEAPIVGVKRAIFLVDADGIIRYRYAGTVRAIFKKPRELAQILASI